MKLTEASYKDIETISKLADTIWNQHYRSIITQQQIDYMLGKMYSLNSLRDQMMNEGHRFLLIGSEEKILGFISVKPEAGSEWFLNKFYIDQTFAAKGIGSAAFDQLVKLLKPSKMTLTVNRQNYKSINFYFKKGFVIERVADFDIGEGYVMNDFVMVRLS
ncbi:MAG: GNAT family N-acetyltransferase [Bacteroidia bacterium]|nr:GNAT family N-acetyltransferase [Bacteroidia bacterium]